MGKLREDDELQIDECKTTHKMAVLARFDDLYST